jgi:hypothetical protein
MIVFCRLPIRIIGKVIGERKSPQNRIYSLESSLEYHLQDRLPGGDLLFFIGD